MRLLSPSENKDLQASETARNLLRAAEAQKIIKETNERLSKSQADFELSLASHRQKWETEEREYLEWRAKINKETEELEQKKKKLLIPIDFLKQEAQKELETAKNLVLRAKEKEGKAEELTELLEDKLDSLGVREENVKKKEISLSLREKNIEGGEEIFKTQQEAITEALMNLASRKAEQEAYIQRREEEVYKQEVSARSKEESLARTEKDLSDWQRRLTDERGVLDANWQELGRKGGNIPIQYQDV